MTDLTLVTQGAAINERDGNSIFPFFLQLKIVWTGQAASANDIYRTIIFRDKMQVTGVVPDIAGVKGVLAQAEAFSLLEATTRSRYKILFDRTFTASNDATVKQQVMWNIRLRLTLPMRWATAASTSIDKNGLYMLNISNLQALPPSAECTYRLLFNDS